MYQGFYSCFSGKKASLHFTDWAHVVRCLVWITYVMNTWLRYFPPVAQFESICKLCGRNMKNPDDDSDVPFTSSSSDEQQQGEAYYIRCGKCQYHCEILGVFVGSRPSKGIAAEIFPEDPFWLPFARIWWRLWLEFAFIALPSRTPTVPLRTATCQVTPHRHPLQLPQEKFVSLVWHNLRRVLLLWSLRHLSTHQKLSRSSSSYLQRQVLKLLQWILEALLRSVNLLCEQLITAFKVQEITDRELLVALDTSEESLRETFKEAFEIDTSKGFAHKRELGKIIKAWNNAKVHSNTRLKLDAVARSHGEPVSVIRADWEALAVSFKAKFGTHLHDTALPAQSYFKGFEELLANSPTPR